MEVRAVRGGCTVALALNHTCIRGDSYEKICIELRMRLT